MRGLLLLVVSAILSGCGPQEQEPWVVTSDEVQALQKAGEMLQGSESTAPASTEGETEVP